MVRFGDFLAARALARYVVTSAAPWDRSVQTCISEGVNARSWPRLCENSLSTESVKNRPLRTRCIRLFSGTEGSEDPRNRNGDAFAHSLDPLLSFEPNKSGHSSTRDRCIAIHACRPRAEHCETTQRDSTYGETASGYESEGSYEPSRSRSKSNS